MAELAWDIGRAEAQAKRWKEMTSVLENDQQRVAWLIDQISYLSASHMQLQQVCKVHADALVRVIEKSDAIEQVQLIQIQSIAERLEKLERKP